jgi:hypothetical protein
VSNFAGISNDSTNSLLNLLQAQLQAVLEGTSDSNLDLSSFEAYCQSKRIFICSYTSWIQFGTLGLGNWFGNDTETVNVPPTTNS